LPKVKLFCLKLPKVKLFCLKLPKVKLFCLKLPKVLFKLSLKLILVSYIYIYDRFRTRIPCSVGREWRGAGGADSRMCYRPAVGRSDRQSYHHTMTEDIRAFRVACSAQVQRANDFRVAEYLSFATKTRACAPTLFPAHIISFVLGLE